MFEQKLVELCHLCLWSKVAVMTCRLKLRSGNMYLSQECYSLTILSFLFCFSQQLYFSQLKCKDKKFLNCTQVHIVTSGSCVAGSDEWHSKVDPQRELPLSMPGASQAVGFSERDAFLSPTSVFLKLKTLCLGYLSLASWQ